MRFVRSTIRRERRTSAPFSRGSRAVADQVCDPPFPLARPKTSGRSSISRISKRKKSAVHPIDLRDLESELELLPAQAESFPIQNIEPATAVLPRGFTIVVSVLHALDLPNPCQIRSCRHALQPRAIISINDCEVASFSATHHAKNYTSWGKSAQFSYNVGPTAAAQAYAVRVRVVACCTRQSTEPTIADVGQVDELVLSADSARECSQFYTVFRYHLIGKRVVKYFAGKLKLAISIHSDAEIVQILETSEHVCREEPHQDSVPPTSLARPSFLPANFGCAIQLKRKQLKATVAPVEMNHLRVKTPDDADEVRELLQSLQVQASAHLVNVENVKPLEPVGQGVHASVRRAELKRSSGEVLTVAMKEFRYANADCGVPPPLAVLHAFHHEYAMLQLVTTASQTQDPHNPTTIRLVGVMLTPRLTIFTDFCRGGSLAKCLENCTAWHRVAMQTRLELARQVASGLARCHALHVVHRDIKAHNIMVNDLDSTHPVIKIGDFGSAVVKRPPDPLLHEEIGSSGYTAPEIFRACGYGQGADIWSLGVVLWELLCTGFSDKLQNPFLGLCSDDVVRKADAGERPVIPPNSLPEWCELLLQRCWAVDPAQRPTAVEIASQFTAASRYDTSQ